MKVLLIPELARVKHGMEDMGIHESGNRFVPVN